MRRSVQRVVGRLAYRAATTALGERGVYRYLKDARAVHRMSADGIRERQQQRLLAMLEWCAREVPYYRNRIPSSRYLSDVPLLEKHTLQRRPDELRARVPGRTVVKSTGGSTGAPVRLVKDADGVAQEMATTWAALEWYGIRIGDPSVRFWGTPLTSLRRVRFGLTDLAMNRIRFSAFDLDDTDLERYWRKCVRFRPNWFYGYGSLIHMFAQWAARRGYDGRRVGLSAIVPTSEPLTQAQRSEISEFFGAPVYDEYGCGEVGAIAYACEQGNLHIMTDQVVLEVLDESMKPVAPGEAGEVVITDLTNRAMPLVRYRLGDRAILGAACPCERGFPVIERILGRVHDVLYTPTGRRWHGEKIDYLMSQLHGQVGGFQQYQVVQVGPGDLEVRLVADGPLPVELVDRIRAYVYERLDGMQARVVRTDRIERAPSGKLRLVRNDWLPGGT